MLNFDDANKWVTVKNVPVLDEHSMTNEQGQEIAYVDRQALEEIAANNNRRVMETGDPAPLILGHTSDDPKAEEKPVVGYAVNYRVAPFKNGRHAIYVDYKIRRDRANVVDEYPRRSVELWYNKKELDPIALLGGTTPERDLGVVIRHARLKGVALLGGTTPARDLGVSVRYDRKSQGTVIRYAMEADDMAGSNCAPSARGAKAMMNPAKYEAGVGEDDEGLDDLPGGAVDSDEGDAGGGDEDPVVAKVLASKQFQDLASKVNQIFDLITSEDGGEDEGMGDPPPGGDDGMAPPPGMDGGGPLGCGMPPGAMGEQDARGMHGEGPVKFEDDGPEMYAMGASGFGGPGSTTIPTFGGGTKGTRYSRNGSQPMAGQQRGQSAQPDPEVIRLQRQVKELSIKNARAEARELVNQCIAEGVVIPDPEQEAAALASLPEKDRDYFVNNVIRAKYARKDADIGSPLAHGGLARFARTDAAGSGLPGASPAEDQNDFTPANAAEATMFADAQIKMGLPAAIKFMRSRSRR